ncbi:hypothetical protein LIA77_10751 [Sarocladium implicatum]|nr:hypothetical protein LIA77_10751 [Sarocladium implicatum]
MALDLHRDPGYLGTFSVKQAILRRRLWVTVLELNLLCALQANQAPLISTADFDTCPPADVTDDELDHLSTGEHVGIHLDRENHTALQSAFYASWPVRSEIVTRLTQVNKDPDYERVLDLHSKFSKERSTFRQIVKDASHKSQRMAQHGNTTAQALMADILMSRYMLALHLPVLGPVVRNPKFHFSRRMAASTAIEMGQMCGILKSHKLSASTPDALLRDKQSMEILFISSAGMLRYIAVQSLYALMLEFVTSTEESLDSEVSFSGCNETELLDHVHDIQKWAEGRVKKGLFDFHNCCFLAAAYAYGDQAGETPDVRESAMVEGAVGSTQRCLAALEDIKAQMQGSQGVNLQNPPVPMLQPELTAAVDFDLMGDFNWADMSLPMFDWSHQVLL